MDCVKIDWPDAPNRPFVLPNGADLSDFPDPAVLGSLSRKTHAHTGSPEGLQLHRVRDHNIPDVNLPPGQDREDVTAALTPVSTPVVLLLMSSLLPSRRECGRDSGREGPPPRFGRSPNPPVES